MKNKREIIENTLLYALDHEEGIMPRSSVIRWEIKDKAGGEIGENAFAALLKDMQKAGLLTQELARHVAVGIRPGSPYKLSEAGRRLAEQLSQGQPIRLPELLESKLPPREREDAQAEQPGSRFVTLVGEEAGSEAFRSDLQELVDEMQRENKLIFPSENFQPRDLVERTAQIYAKHTGKGHSR